MRAKPDARRRGARPATAIIPTLIGLLLSTIAALPGCREDSDTITLEFWTLSLRPTFTGYIEGLVDDFEMANPGVDVVWVDVPFGAVERKLIAAAAAGRSPDVVNMSDLMFARFAGMGAFADLSVLLPGDPASRYHSGALAVGEIGGGLYAVPWYLTTQTMIVNESLLESGGLSAETVGRDWPTLMSQAQTFHAATGRSLFTQPLGQDSQLPMMMLADGHSPFDADDAELLRANLTRPEILAFVQSWVELYRSGAMPRVAATNGFEHLIEVYQNDQAAVLNTGANFLRRVRGVSPSTYEDSLVFEPITGSLGRAHVAVMPLCVSAKSEHPELAAKLAWHVTSPEAQSAFCRLATILPSTPAALDDPFFAGPTAEEVEAGEAKIGEARAIVARALSDAVAFTPALEAWPKLRRAFEAGIKRLLLASELQDNAVADELARVEREWNGIIDAMNAKRTAVGGSPARMDAVPNPPPVSASPVAEVIGSARKGDR